MEIHWRRRVVLMAGILGLLTACASRGSTPSTDFDLLTADQLEPYSHLNAYDAIRKARPQWLRSARGRSSVLESASERRGLRVYVDGILFGGAADLRSLEVRGLQELRFLDAPAATLRYGTNHAEGAIVITTADF